MPKLASKVECTGCTACASACPKNCIVMTESCDGFLYPEIELKKCIDCKRCTSVCPVCSQTPIYKQDTLAYAAYSSDTKMRKESSSGGIFSEFAFEIMKQGGVVFGAAYNEKYEVCHICIEDESELFKLRGAKYAQSSLVGVFAQVEEYLKNGRSVLFSGTPCQIAGLKSFLKNEYNQLMCIDLVCHGVPSPLVWKKYVQYRSEVDNNGALPISINLRSKETGWSHYKYSNVFVYDQKRKVCLNGDNIFMKLFVEDYINRLSCGNCREKGYNRISDITLGDFWGIWDIAPEMDDDKGTSLVLLHSEKGKQLFQAVENRTVSKIMGLNQTSSMNRSLLESSTANPERDEFIEKAKLGKFDEIENLFRQKTTNYPFVLQRIKSRLSRVCNRNKL